MFLNMYIYFLFLKKRRHDRRRNAVQNAVSGPKDENWSGKVAQEQYMDETGRHQRKKSDLTDV